MRKSPSFAEYPTRWFAKEIAYHRGVLSKPDYKGWGCVKCAAATASS